MGKARRWAVLRAADHVVRVGQRLQERRLEKKRRWTRAVHVGYRDPVRRTPLYRPPLLFLPSVVPPPVAASWIPRRAIYEGVQQVAMGTTLVDRWHVAVEFVHSDIDKGVVHGCITWKSLLDPTETRRDVCFRAEIVDNRNFFFTEYMRTVDVRARDMRTWMQFKQFRDLTEAMKEAKPRDDDVQDISFADATTTSAIFVRFNVRDDGCPNARKNRWKYRKNEGQQEGQQEGQKNGQHGGGNGVRKDARKDGGKEDGQDVRKGDGNDIRKDGQNDGQRDVQKGGRKGGRKGNRKGGQKRGGKGDKNKGKKDDKDDKRDGRKDCRKDDLKDGRKQGRQKAGQEKKHDRWPGEIRGIEVDTCLYTCFMRVSGKGMVIEARTPEEGAISFLLHKKWESENERETVRGRTCRKLKEALCGKRWRNRGAEGGKMKNGHSTGRSRSAALNVRHSAEISKGGSSEGKVETPRSSIEWQEETGSSLSQEEFPPLTYWGQSLGDGRWNYDRARHDGR